MAGRKSSGGAGCAGFGASMNVEVITSSCSFACRVAALVSRPKPPVLANPPLWLNEWVKRVASSFTM